VLSNPHSLQHPLSPTSGFARRWGRERGRKKERKNWYSTTIPRPPPKCYTPACSFEYLDEGRKKKRGKGEGEGKKKKQSYSEFVWPSPISLILGKPAAATEMLGGGKKQRGEKEGKGEKKRFPVRNGWRSPSVEVVSGPAGLRRKEKGGKRGKKKKKAVAELRGPSPSRGRPPGKREKGGKGRGKGAKLAV